MIVFHDINPSVSLRINGNSGQTIKNLEKTADRILKAVNNKEKIILYGDADLDGVSSLIILKDTIKNLGIDVPTIYFPNREKEGYGLNRKALDFFKKEAPALLIALDCGIGNFEEIELAKKLGFEVIVIDHHEILKKLPKATIIVDPKQKGDKYPFKNLATVGIVFKLSQVLLKEKLFGKLEENFLELVALATIADLMPRVEDNLIFIEEGLNSLKNTWRPGLKAFFEMNSIRGYRNMFEFAQRIIPALNVSEQKKHLNKTYLILTEKDIKKAKSIAQELLEKSYQKHLQIKEINQEIEDRISKKPSEKIIFEGSKNWPLSLLGPVASRLCQKLKKPVFLFRIDNSQSQGAVRVPKGLNSVELMGHCSKILETYGGHPQASGFRINNKKLENFKNCLIKNL